MADTQKTKQNGTISSVSKVAHTSIQKELKDVRLLLQKTQKLTEEVQKENKKIAHSLKVMVFFGYVKMCIIFIPIIIAIIVIPPYIEEVWQTYRPVVERFRSIGALGAFGGGAIPGGAQVQDVLSNITNDQINDMFSNLSRDDIRSLILNISEGKAENILKVFGN